MELEPADAAALAGLAARTGIATGAIWRAAWALLLARLIGVERVRVGGTARTAMVPAPARSLRSP